MSVVILHWKTWKLIWLDESKTKVLKKGWREEAIA